MAESSNPTPWQMEVKQLREHLQRTIHVAQELDGVIAEYVAMPCDSLRTRMHDTIMRYRSRVIQAQNVLMGASEDRSPDPDLLEIRDLWPSWAKDLADGYMCLGAALPTRDGRRTGNATLVSVNPDGTAKVLTDAGNRMVLTHRELEELFYEPIWTMDPNSAPGYAGDLKL